jgi:hypothetical protein
VCSSARPDAFTHGTHLKGGCMGPKLGGEQKSLWVSGDSNPGRLACSESFY